MPILNIPDTAKSYASKHVTAVVPTTILGSSAQANVFVYCNDES